MWLNYRRYHHSWHPGHHLHETMRRPALGSAHLTELCLPGVGVDIVQMPRITWQSMFSPYDMELGYGSPLWLQASSWLHLFFFSLPWFSPLLFKYVFTKEDDLHWSHVRPVLKEDALLLSVWAWWVRAIPSLTSSHCSPPSVRTPHNYSHKKSFVSLLLISGCSPGHEQSFHKVDGEAEMAVCL